MKRAIQFQAELNKGQTWDFEEDTQTAYQRQVPSGAKAGAVMEWGGKTVAWNQKIEPLNNDAIANEFDAYSVTASVKDAVTVNIAGTFADSFNSGGVFTMDIGLRANRVYLCIVGSRQDFSKWPDSQYRISLNDSRLFKFSANNAKALIFNSEGASAFSLGARFNVGTVIDDTITPGLVDLTSLYGPGNEPTDTSDPRIAQIEAYAAAHPEYNEGELVSALVDEVDVMGANILRPSGTFPYSSGGITAIRNQDSTITINGKASGYPLFEVGRLQLQKGKTYFIPSATRIMLLKDGIRTTIHDNPQAFTPDKDYPDVFLEYAISPNQTFSNTVVALIVSVGSKRDYSHYSLATNPIPSAVQALPGYGWSVGNVANTIERTENGWQYVQRVGSVDLGTLDYTKEENTFRAKLQGMRIVSTDVAFNGRCKSFISIRYRDSWTVDGTMSQDSAKRLVLIHSGYSDIASFLAYVRGTLLYYELATPITTDITALMGDVLAPFSVEAGGSITMHHPKADEGFAVDVPAKIQYITKLSEVSANG